MNKGYLSIPSLALGIFREDTEAKPKYNHSRLRPSGRSSRRLVNKNMYCSKPPAKSKSVTHVYEIHMIKKNKT
jgi:hypothetical protein